MTVTPQARWVTIVVYEGQSHVLAWADPIEARAYFATAQGQWSDACLAQIVTGCGDLGGPPTEDAWNTNQLCELVELGKRRARELEAEVARLTAEVRRLGGSC